MPILSPENHWRKIQWPQSGLRTTGELCALKEARTVRRGAVRKVPHLQDTVTPWPPTLPMSTNISIGQARALRLGLPLSLSLCVGDTKSFLTIKAGLFAKQACPCPSNPLSSHAKGFLITSEAATFARCAILKRPPHPAPSITNNGLRAVAKPTVCVRPR